MALGATCVQKLDGSRDSAIHTKYRISLRSSSMREPRYPLPRVVQISNKQYHLARARASYFHLIFLGDDRAEFVILSEPKNADKGTSRSEIEGSSPRDPYPSSNVVVHKFTSLSAMQVSTMILPQVHLRKPCYDFYFL